MTIASLGTRGTASSGSASTGFGLSPSATCTVGTVLILTIVKDNTTTTDGDNSEIISVHDSKGNTWSKVAEYTNANGSAAAGVTVSVWQTRVTTQLTTSDPISIAFDLTTDKCISLRAFSADTPLVLKGEIIANVLDASTNFGNVVVSSEPTLRVGIIGDSLTDEYRADDNRGGSYASVTFGWVEQLVQDGRINAGVWGTYSTPRRTGYAQNWAHSGGTSTSMISEGQHTGLAAQIASGIIDAVVINIGQNDFAPYADGKYSDIYNSVLSGSALTTFENQVIANIQTAIDALHAEDANIPIVLTLIANWNNSPRVYNDPSYSNSSKRQLVADSISNVNDGLLAISGVTILDADAFFADIQSQAVGTILTLDGVDIDLAGIGDEPHNGVLGDSTHAGTVMQGLLANGYIDHINTAYGSSLADLSNNEILAKAGLATLAATTQHLFFRGMGKEANSTTQITATSGFSTIAAARSRNNANAVLVRGEYRIATTISQNSNPSLAVSGDTVSVLFALGEDTDQSINANFISSAAAVYSPTLSSIASITVDFISSISTVYAPQINETIYAAFVSSAAQVFTSSLSLEIEADFIATSSSVYAPLLSLEINASFIASAAVTYAPTLNLNIAADFVVSVASVYAPTVGLEVQSAFIASTSVVYTPALEPGAVTIINQFIASGEMVYDPSVLRDATFIYAEFISSAAQVYSPHLDLTLFAVFVSTGEQVFIPKMGISITPALVNSTAMVYAPLVVFVRQVEVTFIPSTAQLFAPQLNLGLNMAFIASPAVVYGAQFIVTFDPLLYSTLYSIWIQEGGTVVFYPRRDANSQAYQVVMDNDDIRFVALARGRKIEYANRHLVWDELYGPYGVH